MNDDDRTPTELKIMVAFAVNIGNLGLTMTPRPPMADLVDDLNTALHCRKRLRVLDFFGHTGNFLLECGVAPGEAAEIIGRLLRTPCTVMSVDRVADCAATACALPRPPAEAGRRWTPGVVFRVSGRSSSTAPTSTRVACLQRLDDFTVLAWKRDQEESPGRLDRRRRGGGWGAMSSTVARQLGGVWTGRSLTTLEGVLMRAEEPAVTTRAGITSQSSGPAGSRCSHTGR
jgi:hypothetical protein